MGMGAPVSAPPAMATTGHSFTGLPAKSRSAVRHRLPRQLLLETIDGLVLWLGDEMDHHLPGSVIAGPDPPYELVEAALHLIRQPAVGNADGDLHVAVGDGQTRRDSAEAGRVELDLQIADHLRASRACSVKAGKGMGQ